MAQRRLLRSLQTAWQHCRNRLATEPFAAAAPRLHACMSTWRPSGSTSRYSSLAIWQAPRHIAPLGQTALHGQQLQQQQQQQRAYRCCPGLDGAPPDIISIQFDPEEVDRYISVADAIEAAFPGIVVEGNEAGEGAPGSFEIKASSGEVIFSKLSSGRWPEVEGLIADMQAGAVCDIPGVQAGAAKAAA